MSMKRPSGRISYRSAPTPTVNTKLKRGSAKKVPKKKPGAKAGFFEAVCGALALCGFVLGIVFLDDLAALRPLVEIGLD